MLLTKQQYNEYSTELYTIRDVLRWLVTQFKKYELFFGHGTDNAWDEALTLLKYFIKIDREHLAHVLDARLTGSEKEELYQLIKQRINKRTPLPYITKESWFADMSFYVDNRVLIPRSPLAETIKNNLQPWVEFKQDLSVLEIGTGSACIACALVNQFINQDVNITVDATDISDAALEVAAMNVQDYGFTGNINLINSDLFTNLQGRTYDLIISNPPYVDANEMNLLPAEFLHEPQGALAAGYDGLDIVDKILSQAAVYLKPHGVLIIEVGVSCTALEEKYPKIPFTWIEFADGGEGVFVLTKEELQEYL